MKKLCIYYFCIGLLLLCANYYERHYTIEGQVVDDTTIQDKTGCKWEYQDLPYKTDTKVKIHFYDNGTVETRADDVIIKIYLDK